jgi:hypothetical protein
MATAQSRHPGKERPMKMHVMLIALMLVACLGLASGQAPTGSQAPPSVPSVPAVDVAKGKAPLPAPLSAPTKPPQAQPPPTDPLSPIVPLPAKSDAEKLQDGLQGSWSVVFCNHAPFNNGSLSFAQQRVTIRQGDSLIEVPFTVQPGSERNVLTMRVLDQQLTGSFTVLDGQVLTIRFHRTPATGGGAPILVLTRAAQPSTKVGLDR